MKAAIFEKVGEPMQLTEIRDPKPRRGEVLVKVAACGVCHSDLHVLKGEIGFPLPAVLGHEVSGTIVETGEGVPNFKAGDRIVASFIMACGYCDYCARGRDDLCETFFAMNRGKGALYDGETRLFRNDGSPLAMYSAAGLAQYAVIPATGVFLLPDSLGLEESCILGCAVPTAYGAVKHQAEIEPGMVVAVIGAGGVGSNIVQVAHAFGAEVIAVDIKDSALDAAKKLGALHTVNASNGSPASALRELTNGRGVDVAFEALGRPETVLNAFDGVRDGGKVVVVGLANGAAAAQIEITRLVRRSITIKGSYGARMRSDVPDLIKMVAKGAIETTSLITRRFPFDQVNEAYGALNKGEITGRAIVVM